MTRCCLNVDLIVYSFNLDKLDYTLLTGELDYIDSVTYKYTDANTMFMKKKQKILEDVKKDYIRKLGLAPTDIELGEKGLYILKEEKAIRALFPNIISKGKTYLLEDIVLSHMHKGNLISFYKCDKKRNLENNNYQSFFKDINPDIILCLEIGNITVNEASYLYQTFLSTDRKFQVIRFLLTDLTSGSFDRAYDLFLTTISDGNIVDNKKVFSDNKVLAYRAPYNDD